MDKKTGEGAEPDASEDAAFEAHLKLVQDRLISVSAQIFGHATGYDNAIMIAGYAAFFALWSGVADDISFHGRLVTAGLMCISLLLYIAWQIIQMLTRQKFEWKRGALFEYADDPQRFLSDWDAIDKQLHAAMLRLMRLWPVIFVPTVITGFTGGGVLAYHALASAFQWPQLGW